MPTTSTYTVYDRDGSFAGKVHGSVWTAELEKSGMFCLIDENNTVACAYAPGYWGRVEKTCEAPESKVDKPVKAK